MKAEPIDFYVFLRKAAALSAIVLLLFSVEGRASGEETGGKVVVYFFRSEGCPHCADEKVFLDRLKRSYPPVEVRSFDAGRNAENSDLLLRLSRAHGMNSPGIPALFVGGNAPIFGFQSAETSGKRIEALIRECLQSGCPEPEAALSSPEGGLTGGVSAPDIAEDGICPQDRECPDAGAGYPPISSKGAQEAELPDLPLIGRIDISDAALPLQTLIIAGMDGFNPCAFFVLFTLLGLLMHVRTRKKLLVIGGIFVFFSGFIYLLFMAAWLNIFMVTGGLRPVTLAAGATALLIAVVNIKDFFFFRQGISLTIPDGAKPRLYRRMRNLMKASSMPSVVAGTAVLAAAANAYELLCTAGFPMVYTRILTLHRLEKTSYYLYLAFYNFIYVIPLALIVVLFAFTVGGKKFSEKHGRALKLVSGMMMLFLGLSLIFAPETMGSLKSTAMLFAASLLISAALLHLRGTGAGASDR